MQSVQPNSNVSSLTEPPSNDEAYCSRTTTIAVVIIASLAGFLCLPFKIASGVSVIVLGASAYYACNPKIAETIKPPSQPQQQDMSAPVSTPQPHTSSVTPVMPVQQPQTVVKSIAPTNIEIGDISNMMCTFDTVESRNAFLTPDCQKRLYSCAHIIFGVPEPTKAIFTAKNGYKVDTILSRLCAHHLKQGRPTQITVNQDAVICQFSTAKSVSAFMKSDIAKNLQKSVILNISYNRGSILIMSSAGFSLCDILSEVAKTLVDSFHPDDSSYSEFQSFY